MKRGRWSGRGGGGRWVGGRRLRTPKMAAVELEWVPETLYNTAISAVVDSYGRARRRDIRSLPENIQFDVYYKVWGRRRCWGGAERGRARPGLREVEGEAGRGRRREGSSAPGLAPGGSEVRGAQGRLAAGAEQGPKDGPGERGPVWGRLGCG